MRFFPLGDQAITVEFGNEISLELNRRAIALSDHLRANPFPGFVECVPAYASSTIFYETARVRECFSEFSTAFEAVRSISEKALSEISLDKLPASRTVEIPVNFSSEASLDLDAFSRFSGLLGKEVVEIFLKSQYFVFMIGFLPGFAYLGEMDERIAIPRRDTPRIRVPKGSVAVGGKQAGIYPVESPGGWHIIGRTDTKMFDANAESLCPLQPGDYVQFVRG